MNIVSDLEGTLTEGGTAHGMRDYFKLHGKGASYRAQVMRYFLYIMLARLGLVDVQSMKNAWLAALLGLMAGSSETEFMAMAEWVVEHEMWPARRLDVLAEFEAYRQNGARIVIASGTFQAIADGFARRMGVEALGSDVELVDGRITGRLVGEVSVKGVKSRRAQELVGSDRFDFAYGDSAADVSILDLAHQAVAVYPDVRLRQIATKRGWRILESVQGKSS